jgi:hypothetical protein
MDGYAAASLLLFFVELTKLFGMAVGYPFVPTRTVVDQVQVEATRVNAGEPPLSRPGFRIDVPRGDRWYAVAPSFVLGDTAVLAFVKDPQRGKYARAEVSWRTRTDAAVGTFAVAGGGNDVWSTLEAFATGRVTSSGTDPIRSRIVRDSGDDPCVSYSAAWLEPLEVGPWMLRREIAGRYCAHPACPAVVVHAYTSFRARTDAKQVAPGDEQQRWLQSLRLEGNGTVCPTLAARVRSTPVVSHDTPVLPATSVPPDRPQVAERPWGASGVEASGLVDLPFRVRIRPGDHIRVLTHAREARSGRFVNVEPWRLTVATERGTIAIDEREIAEVWWTGHRARPIPEGAVAGTVVGVLLGVATWALTHRCGEPGSDCAADERVTGSDVLAMTAFGAAVGAGVGALMRHTEEQLVYTRSQARVSAPSSERASVSWTVRF